MYYYNIKLKNTLEILRKKKKGRDIERTQKIIVLTNLCYLLSSKFIKALSLI